MVAFRNCINERKVLEVCLKIKKKILSDAKIIIIIKFEKHYINIFSGKN